MWVIRKGRDSGKGVCALEHRIACSDGRDQSNKGRSGEPAPLRGIQHEHVEVNENIVPGAETEHSWNALIPERMRFGRPVAPPRMMLRLIDFDEIAIGEPQATRDALFRNLTMIIECLKG